MGKIISFSRPDGRPVKGYLVEPEQDSSAPGVVVIQEWWGLNKQIIGEAKKLAVAGYRALVPDLYRGKQALESDKARHLMNSLNFGDAVSQDIRAAVQYLKASGSRKAGINGFCMGGALALLAAVFVPESDANATWYGYPPLKYMHVSKIKKPLLGHWANEDHFFPIDGVNTLEKKLRAASVDFSFYRYDAKHAFANEKADSENLQQTAYHPTAATIAWLRTLSFFDRHL